MIWTKIDEKVDFLCKNNILSLSMSEHLVRSCVILL